MPGRTKTRDDAPEEVDTSMDDAPTSAQQPVEEENGDAMQEDGSEGDEDPVEEEEEEEEPQRVRILPGSSETAASFEFLKEGHTLGNALRYIIMKNPDVEFCAYAIPHPSEDKMNLRIQTYDTTTAAAALAKGLQDIEDLCDVVADEFWTEREKFEATPEQARKRQEEAERRRQAVQTS
ncbi:RBP11-like subunits of RNA polymerase [Daldinia loculata]|uniref:RBP11-like subunits of RNA polymerase n=1 Tax=Daldinia loculata TaxID=103429 RepID=UPI0020C25367|nr:RBP11-like subunits of RNA polymerase [Daldinia loculata]KAI1644556.1 RBP11-like subunits of RNA polymerase [Daldinia loculata]KAI2785455.1 RBP11-like subunits of RNA polymerase [Daldinia loculata]